MVRKRCERMAATSGGEVYHGRDQGAKTWTYSVGWGIGCARSQAAKARSTARHHGQSAASGASGSKQAGRCLASVSLVGMRRLYCSRTGLSMTAVHRGQS